MTANAILLEKYPMHKTSTPVEEYWENRVLQIDRPNLYNIQWELFGCLVLAWLCVYGIIAKGLHSSGKIIWFTALFPYFVMAILLVRALTLEGAMAGLEYYVTPDWEKLLEGTTWIDAVSQVVFAYSVGIGALPALASYNKFHHNCYK